MTGIVPIHSVGTCIVESGAWGISRCTITKIEEYAGMLTYIVDINGVIGRIPVVIGNDYPVCEPIVPPVVIVPPVAPPYEPPVVIVPPVAPPYEPPVVIVPPVVEMIPIHSVGTCIVETGAWGSSRWTITEIGEYAGSLTYFVVSNGVIGHIPVVIGNDYPVCEPMAPPAVLPADKEDNVMMYITLFAIAYVIFTSG